MAILDWSQCPRRGHLSRQRQRHEYFGYLSCAKQWLQPEATPRLIPIRRVPLLLRDLAATSCFDLSHPHPH
jgi:hypothetical protein